MSTKYNQKKRKRNSNENHDREGRKRLKVPTSPWRLILRHSGNDVTMSVHPPESTPLSVAARANPMTDAGEVIKIVIRKHRSGRRAGAILHSFYNYYTANKSVHDAASPEQAALLKGLGSRCLRYVLSYGYASGTFSAHLPLILETCGRSFATDWQDPKARAAGYRRLEQLYESLGFRRDPHQPFLVPRSLCVRMRATVGHVLSNMKRNDPCQGRLPGEVSHLTRE